MADGVEKVFERQKFFQSAQSFTHLKGKGDRLTSVLIPAGLAAIAGIMVTRGLYHLATGTGKLE
jgi:hypothetical protein